MKEIFIKNTKTTIATSIFSAKDDRNVLIITSATGVKQGFYKKFATYISAHNITVITFDYTGIGKSLHGNIKDVNVNAKQWGSIDLESVLEYTLEKYPNAKITVLGHSIGGQIIGLAPSSLKINKIVLVAAQSGYWKLWSGFEKVKMWFNWHLLFPFFITVFGYMPSKKISGMENLPKNVAKQWSSWGRKKEYLLGDLTLEETFFNKITFNIVNISITDDNFAPEKAIDWMTSQYNNAVIKRIKIQPKNFNTFKIGHFGIFREKFKENLWSLVLNEL